MNDWRRVWRTEIAPRLPLDGLKALAVALASCSGELEAGTTVAPWCGYAPDAPPQFACPVGYALWKGRGLKTVREVQAAFNEIALACPAPDGWSDLALFTGWVDSAPWEEVRASLLAEVHRSLALRETGERDCSVEMDRPVVMIAE